MTMTTGDPRLEVVEARLEDLREGQREPNARLDTVQQQINTRFDAVQQQINTRFDTVQQQINARFDAVQQQFNARVDRLLLALIAIGAIQIGLLIILASRGN